MAANALALALHMYLHLRDLFIKYGREHVLDRAIDFLVRSLSSRSYIAENELPHDILTRFPMGLRNVAATYQHALAMKFAPKSPSARNSSFMDMASTSR